MKKLILLSLLLITNYSYSQRIQSETYCSGRGSANSGTYTYEATLGASSYLPGMNDIRYKLALSGYKITSFTYKGIDASTLTGVNFPIYIKNIQADVKFTLQYYNGTSRIDFNSLIMRGVEQGSGDYGDLSSSQVQSLKNKFQIENPDQFYNLDLKVSNCDISKSYFEELLRIKTLIDDKLRADDNKLNDGNKDIEEGSKSSSNNTSYTSKTSKNSIPDANTGNTTNGTETYSDRLQRQERERKEHAQKLARERQEWANRQEAKRIADNKAAEEIADGIIAIGKMFERSPEQIARSKKRRARNRGKRQASFSEYKKTYKSSIRVFGGLTLAQFDHKDRSDRREYELNTGFNVGALAELFPISKIFAFETGLILASKGENSTFDSNDGFYEEKINLYYLEIPITLKTSKKFKKNSEVNATFGPYFGTAIFGNESRDYTDSDGETIIIEDAKIDFDDRFKRIDYGLNLGLGLDINRIFIGISYRKGLADITQKDRGIKNSTYNLSLGYKIK